MARSLRRQRLMDELVRIAFTAESQETQVAAAVAWLDRFEGKPVTHSISATPGDQVALDDLELAAIASPRSAPPRASPPDTADLTAKSPATEFLK